MEKRTLELAVRAANIDEIQTLMARYVTNCLKMDYESSLEQLFAMDHPEVSFELMESGEAVRTLFMENPSQETPKPLGIALERPLIVFDLETTGVIAGSDHIIELAAIKVMPDGTEERKCFLLNPGCPIPPETSKIHGITDEIVKNCPTFAERAREIYDFFAGCDLGGFNSDRFDIPCLEEEFARTGRDFGASPGVGRADRRVDGGLQQGRVVVPSAG